MTALPFISSVEVPTQIQAGKTFPVTISGNWPTPSWEHSKTVIEVDEEAHTAVISYLGTSSGGLMMQVLQPFEANIDLVLPDPGTWKVVCKGKGDNFAVTAMVEQ